MPPRSFVHSPETASKGIQMSVLNCCVLYLDVFLHIWMCCLIFGCDAQVLSLIFKCWASYLNDFRGLCVLYLNATVMHSDDLLHIRMALVVIRMCFWDIWMWLFDIRMFHICYMNKLYFCLVSEYISSNPNNSYNTCISDILVHLFNGIK